MLWLKSLEARFMRTHAGALCIRREVLQKVTWAGLVQGAEDKVLSERPEDI